VAWPYFARSSFGMAGGSVGDAFDPVVRDNVPAGEVTVRRNDQVHAADGEIGRVQGLVIDPHTRHVTHVLLQEGHLWGRRDIAIPIGAVTRIDTGIAVNLTKEEVERLPPVAVDPPDAVTPAEA
jgi:sporulation protein YlmC with PRC-barrel domain